MGKSEDSAQPATEVDSLEEFARTVLQNVNVSNSDDSWSTIDPEMCSSNDKTQGESYSDDQFEGIFYRTSTEETEISLNFVSNVFFNAFRNKLTADFSDSLKYNELQSVFKCTMHIKGLKCDVKVDNTTNMVTVTGVGRLIWRGEYFPKITQTLFRRYVQEADSQVLDSQTEESQAIQSPVECVSFMNNLTSELPTCTSTPIASNQDTASSHMQSVTTILKKIHNMETIVKEMKQSIIFNMERKIEELKSSLIKSIDDMASTKSYVDAVRQRPGSNTSQATDEGYCNISSNTTATDSSQTHAKTVYQPDITKQRPPVSSTPKPVPVRITNRSEGNPRMTSFGSIQNSRHATSSTITQRSHASIPARKTLLIGDSIIGRVNPKGLKRDIQKHSKSGATVSDILNDISMYDVRAFGQIIIYVGGNDASSQVDDELFEEKYDQLISQIKTTNQDCNVYICKIAPRGDTDVAKYNRCIDSLEDHWRNYKVCAIQQTQNYLYGKDSLPTRRYYTDDGIHLSSAGLKRLLDAINTVTAIVDDFQTCVYMPRKTQHVPRYQGNRGGNGRGGVPMHNRNISSATSSRSAQYNQHRQFNMATLRGTGNNRNSMRRCYACQMVGHIAAECWNTGSP